MAPDGSSRLRLLAAELRAEAVRIEATVAEIEQALAEVADPKRSRLALYGAAALLETFYTGVEKALTRIAGTLGGMPDGASWHRRLLDDSVLDLPKLRPPVFRPDSARALAPYLAFRHKFRNLYLFDLNGGLIEPLLSGTRAVWAMAESDLSRFVGALEALADSISDSGSASAD